MSLREQMLQKVAFAPEKFSLEQLKRGVQDGTIPAYIGVPAIQERMKLAQQAQAAMSGQAPQQAPIAQQIMQQAQQAGVEQLPSNLPTEGMAGGGIVAFAGPDGSLVSDDEATRREQEQARIDRQGILSGFNKLGVAAKDVLTLPGRGVAGAFESAVTRPLRAIGVPLPYLPDAFYGGDRGSMTPYMDQLRREEAAAAEKASPYRDEGRPTAATNKDIVVPPTTPPKPEPAPASAGIDKLVNPEEAPFAPDEVFRRLTIGRGGLPTMDYSKTEANIAERRKGLEQDKRDATGEALMAAGFAMMAGTSPYALTNVGTGGIAGLKQYMTGKKDISDLEKDIMSAEAKMEDAKNNQEWKKYEAAQNDLMLKTGVWKTMATITGENERARMYAASQSNSMNRQMLVEQAKAYDHDLKRVADELKQLQIMGNPTNKPEYERKVAEYNALQKNRDALLGLAGMSGVTPASAGAPSNIPPYNRSKVTPQ